MSPPNQQKRLRTKGKLAKVSEVNGFKIDAESGAHFFLKEDADRGLF